MGQAVSCVFVVEYPWDAEPDFVSKKFKVNHLPVFCNVSCGTGNSLSN